MGSATTPTAPTPTSSLSRRAFAQAGHSRDDLLNVNYKIMQQVTEAGREVLAELHHIPVSNPLDAMRRRLLKLSKFRASASSGWPAARLGADASSSRRS